MGACDSDATKSVSYKTLTLTANATLAAPSNSVAGDWLQIDINEGTGPFTVSVASAYLLPAGALTAGNQLVLSGAAGGKNILACRGFSTAPEFHCNVIAGLTAPVAPPAFSIVYSNAGAADCANGTSCASDISGTLQANTVLAVLSSFCRGTSCPSGTATASGVPTKTSGTATVGTCVASSTNAGSGGNYTTTTTLFGFFVWLCPVTGAGTAIMTVNYSTTVSRAHVSLVDIAGLAASGYDDGIGNFVDGGTLSSPSVSTNGNTTQSSEFLLCWVGSANATGALTASGWTTIQSFAAGGLNDSLIAWKISGTALAGQTCTSSIPGASPTSGNTILALKHT